MVDTRDGMETVLLCSHTPPRPTPRACPRQHFLPKFYITLKPVTPQERKTQDVGMAVSMDTISIVTVWGEGGGVG